ncbi:MAG: hypothetical protein PHP32_07420 [Candidatus Izemoplasmatales bacterium]|nr:hypothetical protein [Candidatus Izemoplasmatales bacterium]
MIEKAIQLSKKLANYHPEQLNMVVGFDGFIDEIVHAVDKRIDASHFERIDTMEQFAKRIERAAGLSTNIEFVPMIKKIGGNGPIMANALSRHQSQITYLGSLGSPSIDDVFLGMPENVKLYSFAGAGHTDALEFDDGKVMLGKMVSLNDVTYENLVKAVGFDEFVSVLDQADLFATVNWSMLPHMTELWRKILEEILPLLSDKPKKPIFFVDIADPEKREENEIQEALGLLKEFRSKFKVILGLNKKEAYDVGAVLDLFDDPSLEHMQVSLEDLAQAYNDWLQIDAIVIHPVDRSCTVVDGVYYEEHGPYVKKPKLTTGAGDNFNAGYVLGHLLGLTPDECLLTGMGTSGFYVRNAHSPSFPELIQFLDEWGHDLV